MLIIVFSIGTITSAVALTNVLETKTRQEIVMRAEMLTQSMNAVRSYTSQNIAPLLKDRLNTSPQFIREMIPPIDMTRIGSENITADQWYKGIAFELRRRLDLRDRVNESRPGSSN